MSGKELKTEKQKLEEKYQETIDYLEEIKKDLKEKLEDDRLKYIDFDYTTQVNNGNPLMVAVDIDTVNKNEFPQMKFMTMQIGLLEVFLGYLDDYTSKLKEEKQELLENV